MNSNKSPWGVLALLCIPVFIGSVDLTIVSAILPEVVTSLELPLNTRLDDAAWMITGYLLAYTISMTFTGRLSDILGRRTVYIGALAVFMFGAYFVAVAHTWPADLFGQIYRSINPDARPPSVELRTLYMIITGRVIQALGAGAMAPVTMALVGDLFPPNNRSRPIGLVGAIDTAGWMLGHLYGGVMVKLFADQQDFFASFGLGTADWRTLFWINIVIGAFTMVAVVISLRRVPQTRVRERFDVVGTLLVILTLVSLNVGMDTRTPETADLETAEGFSQYAIPLLIISAIGFLLFVLWESRTRYPLINLNLFKRRNVPSAALANVFIGFALTIGLVALPLLVNFRDGGSSSAAIKEAAFTAGILLSCLTVPMAVVAIPGAWVSDRYGYRVATSAGAIIAAIGFVSAALIWETDTPYLLMGTQMVLVGTGLGMTISPIGTAVINAAQAQERGAASAMVLALRLVGMTLALSSLTTFAINRVNRLVEEATVPGVDPDEITLMKIVQVVNELLLLGAVVSVAALAAAWFMRGGKASELAEDVLEEVT
jgi:MFS family permease